MTRLKQFLLRKLPGARFERAGKMRNQFIIATIGRLADTSLFPLIWEFHNEFRFMLEEVWFNTYTLMDTKTKRRYSLTIKHVEESFQRHKLHISWEEVKNQQ